MSRISLTASLAVRKLKQENLPEDMDESILDKESETESHEESVGAAAGDRPGAKTVSTDGTLSAPEARRDGQAEHKAREDDDGLVDESDMVSSGHNRSTTVRPKNLEIGTGHATVIAARKAASGPSPTNSRIRGG